MAVSTSTSIVALLHTFFDEVAIRVFRKQTFLYQFASIKRIKPQGSANYLFHTINPQNFTISSATLIEGVTPAAESFTSGQVTVNLVQYGAFCTISDIADEDVSFDIHTEAAYEFGRRMAEVVDLVVQNELNANATHVLQGDGSVNAIANITSAMKLTYSQLSMMAANLRKFAAPDFEGESWYVAVVHPFVAFDLLTQATVNGSLFEASKYSAPDRLFNGEVGKIGGVRVVISQNLVSVGTGVSSTVIYPVYVFGAKAYAIVEADPMAIFMVPRTASDSDPIAQRSKVGVKTRFGAKIIKTDSIMVNNVATGAISI